MGSAARHSLSDTEAHEVHVVSRVSLEVITSLSQRKESGGVHTRILLSSTHNFHSQPNGWHSVICLDLLVQESDSLVQLHLRKMVWGKLPSLCHTCLVFHRKSLLLPVQGQTFYLCFESPIFPLLLVSFLLTFPFHICISNLFFSA